MRYLRFTVWSLAVAIASIGQILGASDSLIIICLATIAALLATTPGNAIRLPRLISELLILGVTILQLIAPGKNHPFLRLSITILILFFLRVRRRSAWWAVLIAWFPAH
jgi:hypothetical protein